LDTVSRQIFGDIQETQFSRSKIEIHVHLKNAFPGGIRKRRIMLVYNLWFASHPSARAKKKKSRAAESKRRALGHSFSERICYMFLTSKCRRDRDLGLCTTSILACGEPGNGTGHALCRAVQTKYGRERKECGGDAHTYVCISPPDLHLCPTSPP